MLLRGATSVFEFYVMFPVFFLPESNNRTIKNRFRSICSRNQIKTNYCTWSIDLMIEQIVFESQTHRQDFRTAPYIILYFNFNSNSVYAILVVFEGLSIVSSAY